MPSSIYADPALRPALDPSLYSLQPDELAFFRDLTGINNEDQLKTHILDLQSKAYQIYGYPCIRRFAFLRMKISRLPGYKGALKLLDERQNPILLDIGCCFGNDARKAVCDGWPAQNVIASDLREGFWNYGHELFKSTPETFPVAFVAGDAFDAGFLAPCTPDELTYTSGPSPAPSLKTVTSLNTLRGKISAIHASSFFHLFSEEQQKDLALRLASLLILQPGSVIIGQHGAFPEKGLRANNRFGGSWRMFCHSPASWEQLWADEIFGPAGIKVKVDSQLTLVDRTDLGPDNGGEHQFWVMSWSVSIL